MREPTSAELKAKEDEIVQELKVMEGIHPDEPKAAVIITVLVRRLARVESMCENARKED